MSFIENYNDKEHMEHLRKKIIKDYAVDLDLENIFKHYDIAYSMVNSSSFNEIQIKILDKKREWGTQANNFDDKVAKNNLVLSGKYEEIFKNVADLKEIAKYYSWKEKRDSEKIRKFFEVVSREKKIGDLEEVIQVFFSIECNNEIRKYFIKNHKCSDKLKNARRENAIELEKIKKSIVNLDEQYKDEIKRDIEECNYDTEKYKEILIKKQQEYSQGKKNNGSLSCVSNVYDCLKGLFDNIICSEEVITLKECILLWKYEKIIPYLYCIDTLSVITLDNILQQNGYMLSEEIINSIIVPLCDYFIIKFDVRKSIYYVRMQERFAKINMYKQKFKINYLFFKEQCQHTIISGIRRILTGTAYWPIYLLNIVVRTIEIGVKYCQYLLLFFLFPIVKFQMKKGPKIYGMDYRNIVTIGTGEWKQYILQNFNIIEYDKIEFFLLSTLVIIYYIIAYLGPVILMGIIFWNTGKYLNNSVEDYEVIDKNILSKMNGCKKSIQSSIWCVNETYNSIFRYLMKSIINILCVCVIILSCFAIDYGVEYIKTVDVLEDKGSDAWGEWINVEKEDKEINEEFMEDLLEEEKLLMGEVNNEVEQMDYRNCSFKIKVMIGKVYVEPTDYGHIYEAQKGSKFIATGEEYIGVDGTLWYEFYIDSEKQRTAWIKAEEIEFE